MITMKVHNRKSGHEYIGYIVTGDDVTDCMIRGAIRIRRDRGESNRGMRFSVFSITRDCGSTTSGYFTLGCRNSMYGCFGYSYERDDETA